MPDSPGFWDSLSNGYSYVKGKVSEGATWTENRVSQTADSIQKQLDQTDPVGSAEFGILRGAGGVLYNAAKGTVGTVVDLGEAGVAGAKWVYNNPQQAWQNTKDAAAYVDDLMSDPNKMLALAQQGGGLVYTKLAGLTKQQWEEFKGDIAAANTPGEMGQVAGKWAAKLGLTVYAVRSAIQGLKAICEGGAAAAAEEGAAAKSLKGAAGDEGAASEAGAAKGAGGEGGTPTEPPAANTPPKGSLRDEYMGRTPGKNTRTGQAVQDRMASEGTLRENPITGETEFQASNQNWYPLKDADMSHNTDAVKWWNETGRQYGPKAPEVRQWMLDPDNYTLDHYSINRSAGAKLPDRYLPPLTGGKP